MSARPRLAVAPARPTTRTAATADRYELYRLSVQDPPEDVRLMSRLYIDARGRHPKTLREDFCGTFALCSEWVKSHPARVAYGIDLDPEPLLWGRTHHLPVLDDTQRARLHVIQGDVRSTKTPPVDVVAALNFSYSLFKTRDALRAYFEAARGALADDGVLIIDMMGGSGSFEDDIEHKRRVRDFTYVWEHARFDPVTHDGLFHIHFRFRDGTELTRAFSYDWRVWTMPEVRELLIEAGFKSSTVYAECDGTYRLREHMDADIGWLCHIVAVK